MNISICVIAFTLLVSSIIMLFLKDENLFTTFINTLDEKQKKTYLQVIKERTNIYLSGKFIGLILGLLYLFISGNYSKQGVCIFISITFVFQLLFYKLYPKSTYMLEHLTTSEQKIAWLDIYKYMKKIWIISVILSFIAYFLLGLGLSKLE